MVSGRTPSRRDPHRPGEPASGNPEDGVTVFESNTHGSSSQPSTDPADANAGRTANSAAPSGARGRVDARRVAAVEVGAVTAEIAATAAINGALPTPARAETLATTEAEVSATAAPAPTPARGEPTTPTWPTRIPVEVQGYVRAPAKDTLGIIRAHRDEEGETTASASAIEPARPAVEPLFSNEGIFRKQNALEPGWKTRILGPIAGAMATLRAAGTAFGHKAGSRLSFLDASPGSVPDRVRGPRISNGFGNFSDTRVYAWLASAALTVRVVAVWVGSALATVLLPIVLGLRRLASIPTNAANRWLQGSASGSLESDESDTTRKKRRASPFWLVFVGSGVLLALIIGTNWVFRASTHASSDVPGFPGTAPTLYVAGGGSESPTSPVLASDGPSTSTGRGVSGNGSPSPGTSSTPTGAPTDTPGTTPKPKPVPTPLPTPVHTPTPVITPPPTATPVPTPAPTPVMFATVQATPPTAHGNDATFVVQSLPSATCTLTARRTGRGSKPITSTSFTIGGDGSSGPFPWGNTWAKGLYQVTARCTMPPPDKRSITSVAVSITMP